MVKLLEEPRLVEVNMMLAGLHTGSSVIEGRLDLYSCKLAGTDKEVSKSLEQSYIDELAALDAGTSPATPAAESPAWTVTSSSTEPWAAFMAMPTAPGLPSPSSKSTPCSAWLNW